jgi:hypothetical protein
MDQLGVHGPRLQVAMLEAAPAAAAGRGRALRRAGPGRDRSVTYGILAGSPADDRAPPSTTSGSGSRPGRSRTARTPALIVTSTNTSWCR